MSISPKIKCSLCRKKRTYYAGSYLVRYGSHFSLELHYTAGILCKKCFDAIIGAAFAKAREL